MLVRISEGLLYTVYMSLNLFFSSYISLPLSVRLSVFSVCLSVHLTLSVSLSSTSMMVLRLPVGPPLK